MWLIASRYSHDGASKAAKAHDVPVSIGGLSRALRRAVPDSLLGLLLAATGSSPTVVHVPVVAYGHIL